jgi:ankyrin repeat protein
MPLVDAGAPLEQKIANATPLGWACAMADPATVKMLLDCGADPGVSDRIGVTPLCHAAAAGRVGNLLVLLESGVPPDAASPLGMPPIWLATACGQTRAVRLLLAAGARVDAIHPERKSTAVEIARSRRDQALVKLLEEASRSK